MNYYKIADSNYIYAIGKGSGGTPIAKQEYDSIMSVFTHRPETPDGYVLKLKTDHTWEFIKVPFNPDDKITDTEALSIITGGASNDTE